MPPIQPDAAFGRWKLIEPIGKGHSSIVWRAVDADGRNAAIKLLKKKYVTDERTYERVKNEVLAMKACAGIPGVLSLLDSAIPEQPMRDGDAWLAFPLGTPLSERQEVDIDDAVRICADLASTLSQMHMRGYFHRDIKPQNIVSWEDRWHLTDFGIAAGPELSKQTQEGEKLGPTFYIAPEMLNDATASKGGPADVYSLAKLLWKLVTGQKYPIAGVQLRDHPGLNASGSVNDRRAHMLDPLLEAATQVEPNQRPSMADLARSLAAWFEPVPAPKGPLDLAPLRGAVANLMEPSQSEQRRRDFVQDTANRVIQGFFWPFRSIVGGFLTPLQHAGIYEAHINDVEEGNMHFYRDYSGVKRSFFEYSVVASLKHERRQASIMAGVNLGLRYAERTIPDIHSPAVAAAGWVLELRFIEGTNWKHKTTLLWSLKEEFIVGGPDCAAAQARFNEGLVEKLYPSVEALLDAMRE